MKDFKLDKLADKCEKKFQLHNVMFVLLSACNQNCIHCYIPYHDNIGLSKETIFKCIDEARELGAIAVTFTGGEIFVRKDMMEIIKYARSKFLRVFLMSNGSILNDKMLNELINLHVSGFSTTIFSMDPDVHDKITNLKGSLDKTLHTVNTLKTHGIEITIKMPIMKINKESFEEVKKFALKNGHKFKSTATIFSKLDGDQQCSLQITEGFNNIVKCIDDLNIQDRRKSSNNPCSAGFNTICINYDGNVWPCNTLNLNVGNINNESLIDIWNNSKQLTQWRTKSRKKITECKSCKIKKYCKRCPGLALMEDKNLYGCSSSAKRLAEARFQYKKGGKYEENKKN